MTTELAEFLRSRRAAMRPEDAGVVTNGRRRVPDLRREELAQLAGVSVTYYTRLEQAAQHNASDSVVDSLAAAMDLTPNEHAHLRRLAQPPQGSRRRRPAPQVPTPAVVSLVESISGVGAFVLDHANDILAWNVLAHRLIGFDYPFEQPLDKYNRPNMARIIFLDESSPELYLDWRHHLSDVTGYLRFATSRFPDDHQLTQLIGDLAVKSPEFNKMWARHVVRDCALGVKRLHHPTVGRITVNYHAMELPESSHRLVTYSAAPGSADHAALQLLLQD